MLDKHFIQYLPALTMLSMAAGCAQYTWVHAEKTDEMLKKDTYVCHSEAARLYPPVYKSVLVSPGSQKPSTVTCSGSTCTATPGQVIPPVTREQDVNRANRDDTFFKCMEANGWQRIRVD